MQASQGLAALQESGQYRSPEEAPLSGRHLAHPSTRHRHSGSGTTPTRAGPEATFPAAAIPRPSGGDHLIQLFLRCWSVCCH